MIVTRRLRLTGLLLIVTGLAVAGPALAAGTAVVVAGSGTVTFGTQPSVGNFLSVSTTTSSVATTASSNPFTVQDSTVPGTGWHVTVAATKFCTVSSTCPGGSIAFPTGSLNYGAPASVTGGTGSPTPTLSAASAIDGNAAKTIVSAATTTGGTWTVGTSTLTLTVPASTTPGTYSSDLTFTLVTGP